VIGCLGERARERRNGSHGSQDDEGDEELAHWRTP
jgi:hypothetical protein